MTEKDERSIVSGEPRYGKQDPTWLDHLGDRKPAAVERASEPEPDEDPSVSGAWFDAAMNVVIGTALLVMATVAHPPVWAAAIAAVIVAAVYMTAWECAREAVRYGEA